VLPVEHGDARGSAGGHSEQAVALSRPFNRAQADQAIAEMRFYG
jgi:hypothetical protein